MNRHTQKITWLLIINSTKAEVYEITALTNSHKHPLVTVLENPDARLKSSELTSDKAGSYGRGQGPHSAFSPDNSAHKQEHQHFAKKIADFLEQHRKEEKYHALILCAEPTFHGFLNKAIPHNLQLLVAKNIEKDYISLPENERNSLINKILSEF